MTVPGIGPIISSAMVAAIGNSAAFTKGREFGAWLGLVPKQIATGDRTILGKISRRGNRYLRSLFVQADWVVLVRVGPKHWDRYGLKSWIEAAKKRLHHNVLAIALANCGEWPCLMLRQVNSTDPLLFRELQGRCSLCPSRATWARDLAQDAANAQSRNWREYCPDAAMLGFLSRTARANILLSAQVR